MTGLSLMRTNYLKIYQKRTQNGCKIVFDRSLVHVDIYNGTQKPKTASKIVHAKYDFWQGLFVSEEWKK